MSVDLRSGTAGLHWRMAVKDLLPDRSRRGLWAGRRIGIRKSPLRWRCCTIYRRTRDCRPGCWLEGTDQTLPARNLRAPAAIVSRRSTSIRDRPQPEPDDRTGRLQNLRSIVRLVMLKRAKGRRAFARVRNPRAVLDLYPHELPLMQQRATIAMAIALEPTCWCLMNQRRHSTPASRPKSSGYSTISAATTVPACC